MTTRAPFLTVPYGGYYHREVPKEDEEMTHVGPGTPCGEWMRRFWVPVGYSEEVQDLPQRIRILGEDLVLFRDKTSQAGLLELHCPHRGTSLEFGLPSERGIRCCYHGWLFDVDGTVLETPGEPSDSTLRDRLRHGAYPVEEYQGLVFAYMGPPEKMPPFPIYDTFELPGYRLAPFPKHYFPCNWLQVKENCMDPAHLVFLHTRVAGAQFTEDFGKLSELDYMETPRGMVYIDSRRLGDDKVWIRIADYIPPYIHQFHPGSGKDYQRLPFIRARRTHWAVPVDDTHTMFLGLARMDKDQPGRPGRDFGQADDRPYEERQRIPGDYDAQVGQRPIAVHAMEHLAATDRGVIMLRRLVRRGIEAVRQREDPKELVRGDGKNVATYASQIVVTAPSASDPEADRQLVRQTGRSITEEFIRNPESLLAAIQGS